MKTREVERALLRTLDKRARDRACHPQRFLRGEGFVPQWKDHSSLRSPWLPKLPPESNTLSGVLPQSYGALSIFFGPLNYKYFASTRLIASVITHKNFAHPPDQSSLT